MVTPPAETAPNTIVLIHGFWVTPRSWEHWKRHYEAQGLHGADARVSRLRGRGRGAPRRPDSDRATPGVRHHRHARER